MAPTRALKAAKTSPESLDVPVKVKICGVRTPAIVEAAAEEGADYVGLVLFAKSPRNLTLGAAAALSQAAKGKIKTVAVLVDPDDALLDLGEPLWENAPFTAVLLGPSDIPDLELPEPADPVRFFDAVPLTGTEAAWKRLRGAGALRDAWTEAGIDVRDPNRGQPRM